MSLIQSPHFIHLPNHIIAHALMTTADKSQQSAAVRTLLVRTMDEFGIDGALDDAQFPYRIFHDKPTQFVSFSHSTDCVALIIGQTLCGIDIENRSISPKVAARFYHANELTHLSALDESTQARARNLLWSLKEAMIKYHQGTLTQGIAADFSLYIMPLLATQDGAFSLANHLTTYVNHRLNLVAVMGDD